MADETTNFNVSRQDAEISKIKAEERKLEAERQKIELEFQELKRESAKAWYGRQTFQRFMITILLGAPLVGFYMNYVIIPVAQTDVINARLDNARTKEQLDTLIAYNDSLKEVNEINLKTITDLRSTQQSLDSAHGITKTLLAQTIDNYTQNVEQLRTVSASIGNNNSDIKVKLAKQIDRGATFENHVSHRYDGIVRVIDSLNTSKHESEQQLLKSGFSGLKSKD
jgi:hypothetical protein